MLENLDNSVIYAVFTFTTTGVFALCGIAWQAYVILLKVETYLSNIREMTQSIQQNNTNFEREINENSNRISRLEIILAEKSKQLKA